MLSFVKFSFYLFMSSKEFIRLLTYKTAIWHQQENILRALSMDFVDFDLVQNYAYFY